MTLPTVEFIKSAGHRDLVSLCGELGLGSKGKTSILRKRLLEHVKKASSGPEETGALLENARLMARMGRPKDALELLRSAPVKDEHYWLEAGNCHQLLGRAEEALRSYDSALALKKSFRPAILAKQALLADISRYDEAMKVNLMLPEEGANPVARVILLQSSGRLVEALRCCDLILAEKELEHVHNLKGLILMKFGKHAEALECFERALALNEGFPEGWNNKAVCLFKLKLPEEAEEALERAIELKNDYATAWSNRAVIALDSGRPKEAVEFLEISLAQLPTSEGWNNLGLVHLKGRRNRKAMMCFNKALELDRTCAEAWNNKGILMERTKRLPEARRCYQKALMVRPGYEEARKNLARVGAKKDRKA